MEKNENPSLYRMLIDITSTFFRTTKDIVALANAEAKLATQSLINIAILYVLVRILLMTTWLSLCAGILLILVIIQNNWMLSFLEIAILNFILMLIASFYIVKMKNNLSFSATRRQLFSSRELNEDTHVANSIEK